MTRLILVGLLLAAFFVAEPLAVAARVNSARSLSKKRQEAVKRWELPARAPSSTAPSGVKNITFSNFKASRMYYARLRELCVFVSHTSIEFYVDGSTIPDVDFDVGPSWSGLLPISAAANETRMVCFLVGRLLFSNFMPSYSSGSFLRDRKEA
jgi:carboxypeptidase D